MSGAVKHPKLCALDAGGHFLSEFGRCHLVLGSDQAQGGLCDRCCGAGTVIIAVAGNKVGMKGGIVIRS